jgi:uncharacterized repeat protein (TIGR01451 family)
MRKTIFFLLFISLVNLANSQIITTIAGNPDSTGATNGTGTAATFNALNGLAADSANLYIPDYQNNLIRQMNWSTRMVTTLAGNLAGGTANGTGTAASFNLPSDVALDGKGNLYVVDNGNNLIRKIVISTGVVSTLAGNIAGGSANGTGTAASFNFPWGITYDGNGNLFIADQNNNLIRKIVISSGAVSTLAGHLAKGSANGTGTAASFNQPWGLTCDGSGNLFVADEGNNLIRKIVISTGAVTTLASLVTPSGIRFDGKGNLFVTDQFNNTVSKIVIATQQVIIMAGTSPYNGAVDGLGIHARFYLPSGEVFDTAGNLYIAEINNNDIRKMVLLPTGYDLAGSLTMCIDTPNFSSASIQACIFNNRYQVTKGTMKLVLDTAFHITSTISDSVAKQSGDTLIWHYDSLSSAGKTHCVTLNGTVSNIPAGDSIFASLFITPVTGDSNPSNNSVTYWVKAKPNNCVGLPFDPNTKSVSPTGNIAPTQLLTYSIHFQNTGTAVAHNVVVIDTLSSFLDPTTLKVLSSSSYMTVQVVSGNIIKFIFDGINLPDTAMSKTTSIGGFSFTIKPMSNVVAGDRIVNNAGIYFDSNPAIITNSTVSTISGGPLSVQKIANTFNVACFPNPFTTSTSVVFNTDGRHVIEIHDVTGRKVETIECIGKQYELQRNSLASGLYFIKAFDGDQSHVAIAKIVLQ